MVYRIYVEKKPGFDGEAQGLLHELVDLVGIQNLTGLRLLNRYDVEGIDAVLFQQAVPTVFSEPPVDVTYDKLPAQCPHLPAGRRAERRGSGSHQEVRHQPRRGPRGKP